MFEIFAYKFMQTAFIAATLVAVLCATFGLFIVLRKLSFITDGIAHISLSGIALALATHVNVLAVTLAVAIASGLGINRLREKLKLSGDTAIGLMFPVGLAAGIILLSLAKATSIDITTYLFGSILAISEADLWAILVFGAVVLAAVLLLRKQLLYIAFDEESARASGLPVTAINYAFFALIGATVVLSVRIAGILLISSLVIAPPSAALQLKKSFKTTLILSCIFGVVSAWSGITASYYLGIPTGAAIAISSFAIFLAAYLLRPGK